MNQILDFTLKLGTILDKTLPYIVKAPYFWASMGLITAVSMLLTALIFDHDIQEIKKATFAKFMFIIMLFYVTFSRVSAITSFHDAKNIPMIYAGIVTILVVTLFWFIGTFFGVLTLILTKKHNKREVKRQDKVDKILNKK